MGDPTGSYATAGIALRFSGALKPNHHDKVKTPLVGRHRLKGDIKIGLEEIGRKMWTGFIWLRVGTSGEVW
jgi:hypothetical protein